MWRRANPDEETTDRRAVCGRTACTVRRAGRATALSDPYQLHWNGTKLVDVTTMREWAKSMTWKGIHPIVTLSRKGYQKGISLSKRAMKIVEDRLERHPELSNWDILIQPVSTS